MWLSNDDFNNQKKIRFIYSEDEDVSLRDVLEEVNALASIKLIRFAEYRVTKFHTF